jgi:hypothetical protein
VCLKKVFTYTSLVNGGGEYVASLSGYLPASPACSSLAVLSSYLYRVAATVISIDKVWFLGSVVHLHAAKFEYTLSLILS